MCGWCQGESATRISAWVDEQAGAAARLPAFVEALATQILQAAVPEPEVGLGSLYWAGLPVHVRKPGTGVK